MMRYGCRKQKPSAPQAIRNHRRAAKAWSAKSLAGENARRGAGSGAGATGVSRRTAAGRAGMLVELTLINQIPGAGPAAPIGAGGGAAGGAEGAELPADPDEAADRRGNMRSPAP